ncbi:MAG: ABC transporter substrate-binding protein [Gemmatimonadetes bacterium]|nr:ABC transporter substrate-binding protein [Gemmatimonadota bacterium]
MPFPGLLVVICLVTWLGATDASPEAQPDIGLTPDPTPEEITGTLRLGSHVKLFLPNLPYLAISHAINAALVRPANNEKGWQYDLAISHQSIDDRIWEFDLHRSAHFQDGTPFDADAVLRNMAYFVREPFKFTKLSSILERVEKVDDYTVRFHLSEPYGVFLHDAMWLQFYTEPYLQKFGWNGKPTCPNLAEPGPYGMGPYRLHRGYVEGDRSASEVVLIADPDYWGAVKAKVDTITIYTELGIAEARDLALFAEGSVDLTPVPFADQVQTVTSPFAKLAVAPSMNNYAMHFNMLNGDPALVDDRIRFVIHHAIDQEYLLNLSMLGEGALSPTMVSPNFYQVGSTIDSMAEYFDDYVQRHDTSTEALRHLVAGYQSERGLNPSEPLRLVLYAQESFLFLIRDIQYFLRQVNIELSVEVVGSEKMVFRELLSTWQNENEQAWDLLLWGNYDWYKHPWAAFFVYRPGTAWCTIPATAELVDFTDRLVQTHVESAAYRPLLADFIRHVYERNYMLFLPTPNNVYAVNKEVVFNPGRSAFVYLRDLEVTAYHWSIRGSAAYPDERLRPRQVNRQGLLETTH